MRRVPERLDCRALEPAPAQVLQCLQIDMAGEDIDAGRLRRVGCTLVADPAQVAQLVTIGVQAVVGQLLELL
ncbi:hypothetical protein D3C78_1062660 [compost metagenome]